MSEPQNNTVQLPPLEQLPKIHGYPICDCDLVGGDANCELTPTLDELYAQYGALQQRERQLFKALTTNREMLAALKAFTLWCPRGWMHELDLALTDARNAIAKAEGGEGCAEIGEQHVS
jgi:hypothetical protein